MTRKPFAMLLKDMPDPSPTGPEFTASQQCEHHRHLLHGLLQANQALGRIAALGESFDNRGRLVIPIAEAPANSPAGQMREGYAAKLGGDLADLILAAMDIAQRSPFGPIDLDRAIMQRLETRRSAATEVPL